jgi:hypothetical protein
MSLAMQVKIPKVWQDTLNLKMKIETGYSLPSASGSSGADRITPLSTMASQRRPSAE